MPTEFDTPFALVKEFLKPPDARICSCSK